MTEKSKRKINPRRRLLICLIVGILIFAALIPLVLRQFEPEHLYLVYESYDEETYAANLYLYDATIGETVRQITDNTDSDASIIFDTAENAPFVVYQYISPDANFPVMLVNLKTWHEREIMPENTGRWSHSYNISSNGDNFAYRELDYGAEIIFTYLINVQTGVKNLVHEFDYGVLDDEAYGGTSVLDWTKTSLTITYVNDRSHTIYEHDLRTGRTNHLIEIPIDFGLAFPAISDDGLLINYSNRDNGSPLRIIRSDDPSLTSLVIPVLEDTWDLIDSDSSGVWRPDSHDLLVWIGHPNTEPPPDDENLVPTYHWNLALLNADTNTLSDLSEGGHYTQVSLRWNGAGSHLFYERRDRDCELIAYECNETVIHDMETGEEIVLPLSGGAIHWVRIP